MQSCSVLGVCEAVVRGSLSSTCEGIAIGSELEFGVGSVVLFARHISGTAKWACGGAIEGSSHTKLVKCMCMIHIEL